MSRSSRRRALILTLAAGLVAIAATASFGYWKLAASGSGTATAGRINAPTNVTVTTATKLVNWTASSTAGTAIAPLSYLVERSPNTTPRDWTTTACTGGAGSTSCTDGASIPSAAGTYDYRYRATAIYKTWTAVSDESAVVSYVVAPSASPNVPGTPDMTTDSGTSATDNITNVTTPTFTGSIVGQANQSVHIFVDGVDKGTGSGTGSTYSVTTSALTDGLHTIQAKATIDGTTFSNNNGSLNITIDTQAPSVGAPTSNVNNTNSNGKPITGTAGNATNDILTVSISAARVSGGNASDTCTLSASSAAVTAATGAWPSSGTVSLTYSARPMTCSVTVTQSDLAGNQGSNSANITRS